MTPRAPVALSCSRRGGKLSFVKRPRVRSNPATSAQFAEMLPKIQRKYRSDEDQQGSALEGLVRAFNEYDPSRGEWEPFARTRAQQAVDKYLSGEYAGGAEQKNAKKELDKYRKEYERTHPKDSPPYSALQLSAVAGMSVQDIQELMEKASFGMTVSSSSAIGGDEVAEDERTIEDTLTASGSLEENEESLIRSMDSQLVQKASTVMTLEERKFLDQIRRGFSVVATAKRMGISRTKATTLKRNVMAHLSMAGST